MSPAKSRDTLAAARHCQIYDPYPRVGNAHRKCMTAVQEMTKITTARKEESPMVSDCLMVSENVMERGEN